MSEKSKYDRRKFMGAAAMTVAATQLRVNRNSGATSERIKSPLPVTSLGPVKQIQAGLLNVGYVEAGPANGTPVVLLHGWPYDIQAFVDVAPLLAAKRYRVIVPYLRGYGSTRFLSNDALRNGQPSALALDTTALLDALKIEKAILAGFDWGARTANIIAALWPERCNAMVSVSGYLIGSQAAGRVPLPRRRSWAATRAGDAPPTSPAPSSGAGWDARRTRRPDPGRGGSAFAALSAGAAMFVRGAVCGPDAVVRGQAGSTAACSHR